MHPIARSCLRLLLIVLVSVVALNATGAPAGADGFGGAITDDDGIDFGAIAGGGHGGTHTSGGNAGSSGPTCTYILMGAPDGFPVHDIDGNIVEVATGGAWYEKTCDGVFYGAVYLAGPPDAVDPAAVAAGVLKRMTIPTPDVAFSPSGDQIVNLASWMWIPNWAPLSGTATVGGITVRVTAEPSGARWTFGDGTTTTCAPGVEWTPTADPRHACTHVWARSSASQPSETFRLGVTVNWTASYTVSGGAGGGALAPLTRTATTDVRVAEVQAVNDRAGG